MLVLGGLEFQETILRQTDEVLVGEVGGRIVQHASQNRNCDFATFVGVQRVKGLQNL